MQPKVSIIVPVYNVEKYIEKCARTLFEQTLDDIEYIFINDCTPDNSINVLAKVLEDYPERKNLVKIINHHTNQGVSKSRQDGIDYATGEYIIHCDPDDWVALDIYELLYEKAKGSQADLVICNYSTVSKDSIINHFEKPKNLTSISVLECISGRNNNYLHASLCNKLLKSSYYKQIRIPENISFGEDMYVWFQVLSKSVKIEYVDSNLYYYRDHLSGLVHTSTKKTLLQEKILIGYIEALVDKSSDIRYVNCCKSAIISIIYLRLFIQGDFTNKDFKSEFSKYSKYLWLNTRLSKISLSFLYLAMKGFYHQAKIVLVKMYSIYKLLKRV